MKDKIKCNLCTKEFKNSYGLNVHKSNIHVKHIKYECEICNKTFKKLGAHVSQKHNISSKNYYDLYLKKVEEDICVICENKTGFNGLRYGYLTTCSLYCSTQAPKRKEDVSKGLQKVRLEKNDEINAKRDATCITKYGHKGANGHPDIIQKVRDTCITKYGVDSFNKTKEAREHSSRIQSERIISGKCNYRTGSKHQGNYYSAKNKKEMFYRSSYELTAYKILEQMSKVWKYENEPFRIPYIDSEGLTKNYVPDILVTYKDGSKELIEVKPECFVEDDMVMLKAEAAIKYCDENDMEFSFWTEKDLKYINN